MTAARAEPPAEGPPPVEPSLKGPPPVEPLVEARGLTKHFPIVPNLLARALGRQPVRQVRAVEAVDLAIQPGETLGVVGESGCGKTTLGRLLIRLHEPTAGEIRYRGRPLVGDTVPFNGGQPVPYHRLAQIIFQNPYTSLNPRKTVRQTLHVPLRHRGVSDPLEREREARVLLERVGLQARHLDAYPHQFSGGQRQRIGIARALAMRPEFVVADEPVSSLDVSIQAQVINLLEELQRELGLTYLFISHDLSVVQHLSDRVAVMYLGRIVELAPTADLFIDPLHPYTQALLSAIPTVEEPARERIVLRGSVPSPIDPPPGCPFHPRCPLKIGPVCEEVRPPLVPVRPGHGVACHLHPGTAA